MHYIYLKLVISILFFLNCNKEKKFKDNLKNEYLYIIGKIIYMLNKG